MFILVLALVLLVVYLSVNVAKVIVYNHRAHKFFQTRSPGLPILTKPNIFFGNIDQTTWNRKNCDLIDELHKKLGKTFGYYYRSQPWVSTKDIDLLKKIELDEASKHLDRAIIGFPTHELNTSIFQVNGDEWRQVRRAIAPTMTNHKVRSDEVSSDIEQVIEQFVQALERKLNQAEKSTGRKEVVLNAHNYAQRITLAIIFLVMYKKENIINFDAAEDNWTKTFERAELSVLHPVVKLAFALPFLLPFVIWVMRFHPFGQLSMRITEYIQQADDLHQAAKERYDKLHGTQGVPFRDSKNQPGFKRRLIDGVIDALKEGKINKEQFVGSANFLLMAAFETTAVAITCLLWQLAQHPDVQTKLRDTIITEGIDADYVVWCIMETIRCHPPAPLGTGRVVGENITTTDGLFIPKGTFVMASIYSIHRDESIWPNHDKYMPERWRYSSKFHPAAFMGFGLGPRNCVGGKMAIHEIKLLLRAILIRYKISKCEQTPAEYHFTSPGMIYSVPDEPIKLQFTPLHCERDKFSSNN